MLGPVLENELEFGDDEIQIGGIYKRLFLQVCDEVGISVQRVEVIKSAREEKRPEGNRVDKKHR